MTWSELVENLKTAFSSFGKVKVEDLEIKFEERPHIYIYIPFADVNVDGESTVTYSIQLVYLPKLAPKEVLKLYDEAERLRRAIGSLIFADQVRNVSIGVDALEKQVVYSTFQIVMFY